MNIYIDESGGFSNPQNKPHAISCVAGLVIPERIRAAVEADYVRLRHSWGLADTEVKGRQLDEVQVAQVINLLRSHDLVVDTCMLDLGIEMDTQIELHKQAQIIRMTEHADPTMPVYKNIIRLQDILKRLPNQLYIQSQLMVELCWRIAQTSTIYYGQRYPEELGEFHWNVDAKDRDMTPYEDFWVTVIAMLLQSKSMTTPFVQVQGCDYTHFERFYKTTVPEYLRERIQHQEGNIYLDATMIFKEHIHFPQSGDSIGIQLADIVASTFRRALSNHLQRSGWKDLGRLMIHQKDSTVGFSTFGAIGEAPSSVRALPYGRIINYFHKTAKSILI